MKKIYIDRQPYYREVVGYFLRKFYQIELESSKNYEVLMPEDRIDLFFELKKYLLRKANKLSPFPYFAELNLVHIKAYNDPLKKIHVTQYLHQLYGQSVTEKNKNKSIVLLILTAQEPSKSVFLNTEHKLERTEHLFIDKIKADYPAYLFVLERLPVQEKYWYFVPFFSLKKLEKEKEKVLKLTKILVKQLKKKEEYKHFLVWFNILQNEFYKEYLKEEVEMVIGEKKEVLIDIFPTLTKQIENESLEKGMEKGELKKSKEDIINLLQIRFKKKPSEKLKKKIKETQSKKILKETFTLAAKKDSLKEFETEFNKLLKKKK